MKNKKVLFYNIQAKLEEEKEIDIDIFKVQGELKKLENNKMLWTGKKRRREWKAKLKVNMDRNVRRYLFRK